MKRRWLLVALVLLPVLVFGQNLVINGFETAPADTNWYMYFADTHGGVHYGASENSDSLKSFIYRSYVGDNMHDGAGAMRLEWGAHNIEGWGGYSKLEHWHPDSSAVYDFSAYDSLEFWYYVETPSSTPESVHLRFNLHDVSNSPKGNKTYEVADCEYYYSFHYILDDTAPGWKKISIPLVDGRTDASLNEWDGEAFNRTSWNGITGNDVLDKDKIKGWSWEFSIGGAGEGNHETGVLLLDYFAATGFSVQPIVFFNGKTQASFMSGPWSWGQSSLTIDQGTGATEGTNSIKWTQGDEWGGGATGGGWNLDPAVDMKGALATDTLRFKLKTADQIGPMVWQIESATAKIKHTFQPITDDTWHQYAIGFDQFVYAEGTAFDSSAATVIQMMAADNAIVGAVIYIDDLWTGNPMIDVVGPEAPTGVNAIADAGFNQVVWVDVPGEDGETYTVYASMAPITDITASGVDLIASNIGENTQSVVHYLYYPLEDMDQVYYYAVTCTDDFGNVSETAGVFDAGVLNTASGIGTISLTPPANFVADGDLAEWDAAGIQPIVLNQDMAFVSPWNTGTVTDDDDLSANVYLAIDDNFLYIAADVIDDVYSWSAGNWWEQDVFEMFIGLYDRRGAKHASNIKEGVEPDYKIYMNEEKAFDDHIVGELTLNGENDYSFTDLGGADYVIEYRVPLDSLVKASAGVPRFHPERGMRIPIELTFHDNDGIWEGNLTTSAYNNDNAHQTPTVWFETWIGDTTHTTTAVDDNVKRGVSTFALSQNYPNPFNPTTAINYVTPRAAKVTVTVYNTLGQRVMTLVDGLVQAGQHQVNFNGADLASGIYFYKLESGKFTEIRKMILMK